MMTGVLSRRTKQRSPPFQCRIQGESALCGAGCHRVARHMGPRDDRSFTLPVDEEICVSHRQIRPSCQLSNPT
jgi:hypothetical protein